MNDAKTVSEVEAVKRERAAWVKGAEWGQAYAREGQNREDIAAGFFPPPKVMRPRVVTINKGLWRVVNGVLQVKDSHQDRWWPAQEWTPTLDRVKAWADLLANPTELVEASDV